VLSKLKRLAELVVFAVNWLIIAVGLRRDNDAAERKRQRQ
jgi:hypothetical protein